MKKIIVTGGAGFIGSALIRYLIKNSLAEVYNIDKLTYAGNLSSLKEIDSSINYHFNCIDICDVDAIKSIINDVKPDSIMHLAAESHVDRSIDDPLCFVRTNVFGTTTLLQYATEYWKKLDNEKKKTFRFQHISTDEVYGSLIKTGYFKETTAYDPKSPYSASKASSDHFVRAYNHTFGLPILISNCSNNYGPYHFPEKLIPLVILNALEGKDLPIYGKGDNIRDWLFVDDHVKALWLINQNGIPGETYNIGGHNERTNLEVVKLICAYLNEFVPKKSGSYEDQITFVEDRPGHDVRYAIDSSKLVNELHWKPDETFETGLAKTVKWYLDNKWWWEPIRQTKYNGNIRIGTIK